MGSSLRHLPQLSISPRRSLSLVSTATDQTSSLLSQCLPLSPPQALTSSIRLRQTQQVKDTKKTQQNPLPLLFFSHTLLLASDFIFFSIQFQMHLDTDSPHHNAVSNSLVPGHRTAQISCPRPPLPLCQSPQTRTPHRLLGQESRPPTV